MKTKAFSKEGLTQAAKLDPKEQEREEIMAWLQSKVEELELQIEVSEAEIESLQGLGKKRGKTTTAGKLEELEHMNERRKWHISRLEIVLRLLNNGSLESEKAISLKDDVAYFVDSNVVWIISICSKGKCSPEIYRTKISTSMRGSMMSSILRKKRNDSVAWYMMMTKVTSTTTLVKVRSLAIHLGLFITQCFL